LDRSQIERNTMPTRRHYAPPQTASEAVDLLAKLNGVTADGASDDDKLNSVIAKTGYSGVFAGKTFDDLKSKIIAVTEATGNTGLVGPITE